jgi:hypothetical protein
MEQQKEPDWNYLFWQIVIAGCYERRRNQCELPNDEYYIEQWEKARDAEQARKSS